MTSRSPVLDACVRAVFHLAVLTGVYLLFAGHNAPGGGFIGGLVVAAALVLRRLTPGDRIEASWIEGNLLVGVGLVVVMLTAMAGWIDGGQLLETAKLSVDLGPLGQAKVTSALPFDVGVFLVITGLMASILDHLGDGLEEEPPDGASLADEDDEDDQPAPRGEVGR